MQTINNRMTETQIADLFSLAVKLQVKAEESDDRDTAILAYSIQNACSNLTESQREFRAADATIHNLELKLTDMAVQLANAESKCRELAAEHAAMKKTLTTIANSEEFHGDTVICDFDTLVTAAWSALNETTATDAFLAEVRASELDSLAGVAETMLIKFSNQSCSSDMHEVVGWKKVLQQATNRAAKLRKGAAYEHWN
ncbi:hypothetical protein [Citrobacter sp. Cf081]|uniref:hypothetical protein n=1 Tax=Citrobacter sp. Cf081 TaxID=2985052 RepID=UPI002574CCB0|nr:hypothetical protein [Citrobacter sp. Cf081]MDM3243765.1 hypothetical protein [Citrobacter sp. Cf081]